MRRGVGRIDVLIILSKFHGNKLFHKVGKSKIFEYMKEKLAKFVFEGIVTCFEIPFQMVSNNGPHFISDVIKKNHEKVLH